MDEPLFLPGDQKTFAGQGTAHPRLIATGFFILMIGVAFIGVFCLYVGKWVAGILLTAAGLGVAGFMAYRYIAEVQMVGRMHKRGTAGSNEPRST